MFIGAVNTAYINNALIGATIFGMAGKEHHSSLDRLLEAAQSATERLPPSRQIRDQKALQRAMGQTPQGWNAWKDRGLSKEAALKGEELFGCSAVWLLSGRAPTGWAPAVADPMQLTPGQELGMAFDALPNGDTKIRLFAQLQDLIRQASPRPWLESPPPVESPTPSQPERPEKVRGKFHAQP